MVLKKKSTVSATCRTPTKEQIKIALKKHIMRRRVRLKQEEDPDYGLENKTNSENLSLEQVTEQLKLLEERLQGLKDEKHSLFVQLKKVLNEDDAKRRQQQSSSQFKKQDIVKHEVIEEDSSKQSIRKHYERHDSNNEQQERVFDEGSRDGYDYDDNNYSRNRMSFNDDGSYKQKPDCDTYKKRRPSFGEEGDSHKRFRNNSSSANYERRDSSSSGEHIRNRSHYLSLGRKSISINKRHSPTDNNRDYRPCSTYHDDSNSYRNQMTSNSRYQYHNGNNNQRSHYSQGNYQDNPNLETHTSSNHSYKNGYNNYNRHRSPAGHSRSETSHSISNTNFSHSSNFNRRYIPRTSSSYRYPQASSNGNGYDGKSREELPHSSYGYNSSYNSRPSYKYNKYKYDETNQISKKGSNGHR